MSSANPNRIAGGFKATINNPNISEQAKMRASDQLEEHEIQETESIPSVPPGGRHNAPRAAQPKQPLTDTLEDDDTEDRKAADMKANEPVQLSGSERGGYKATLKNPRISSEAKGHAQDMLDVNEEE